MQSSLLNFRYKGTYRKRWQSYSYSYRVSLLNNCSQRNHAVGLSEEMSFQHRSEQTEAFVLRQNVWEVLHITQVRTVNAMQIKLNTSLSHFTVFAVHNQISTHLKYYFKQTSWAWSLSVTWQRWRPHHSIRHSWKSYAICKHHCAIFYRAGVIADRNFSCSRNANFV